MAEAPPPPSKPANKGFPIAITVVLSFVVLMFTSMLIRGRTNDDTMPVITTSDRYNEVLDEIEKITDAILEKADREEPLTDAEIAELKRAEPRVDGLIAYDPGRFTAYVIGAQIAFAEERYEPALGFCNSAIERAPAPGTAGPDVDDLIAETRYLGSRAYFKLGAIKESIAEAKAAHTIVPRNPKYAWALASAYSQNGDTTMALKTIADGQIVDPKYDRLITLATFILKSEGVVGGPPRKADPKK